MGVQNLPYTFTGLTLCRAWLGAKYCMVLPIFVWTSVPHTCRVVREGGIACLIGPVHPTFWLSRWFADAWMLFPTETEYTEASAMPTELSNPRAACNNGRHAPVQQSDALSCVQQPAALPVECHPNGQSGDGSITVTFQVTRGYSGGLDTRG